jgi:hypothetical protein
MALLRRARHRGQSRHSQPPLYPTGVDWKITPAWIQDKTLHYSAYLPATLPEQVLECGSQVRSLMVAHHTQEGVADLAG